MTQSNDREHCLERARMHEDLARSTNDGTARRIHQAMAAEFRRRADRSIADEALQPQSQGPVAQLIATVS